MVSALVVSLLAVLLAAGQSPTQPPEISLPPGLAMTIAPGQTTTVRCETGLARCVYTYNQRPGEFSYELNWIVPTLPPRSQPHLGATGTDRTVSSRWDRRPSVSADRVRTVRAGISSVNPFQEPYGMKARSSGSGGTMGTSNR